MDTAINCSGKIAYVSSEEKKFIKRILALKEEYPDKVEVIKRPEENDGCIYARMPSEFVQLKTKVKQNLTDEQRKMKSITFKERFHPNQK